MTRIAVEKFPRSTLPIASMTPLVEPRLAEMLKPDIVELTEWMIGRGWSDERVRAGIQEFLGSVHKRFPGYVRIEGYRKEGLH